MNTLKEIRNKDLVDAYNRAVSCGKFDSTMVLSKFIDKIVNGGAPRFYISERKLLAIVSSIRSGKEVGKTSEKKKMYDDLYRVYCEKEQELSCCYKITIAEAAVNSPAPSFYIKRQRAIDIIYGNEEVH